jgi:acyl phosphate:glycerol-3-phosphate acyltransferase
MLPVLLTATYSYLLGSIPFGYILVRVFRGSDVRETGSGNIGATNVARTSPALGLLTLALDGIKGMAAVWLTQALCPGQPLLLGVAALSAIVGHVFPVWLKFRGGKGVATALGSFGFLFPKTILVIIGIFLAIFLLFRQVSLASIVGLAFLPILAWRLSPPSTMPAMVGLTAAASLLIVAKHHENIRRLLNHTEPRFQWRHK